MFLISPFNQILKLSSKLFFILILIIILLITTFCFGSFCIIGFFLNIYNSIFDWLRIELLEFSNQRFLFSTTISGFYLFIANNNPCKFLKDSSCEPKRCSSTFCFATHVLSYNILYLQCNFISSCMLATFIKRYLNNKGWYNINNKICIKLMMVFLDKSRNKYVWPF